MKEIVNLFSSLFPKEVLDFNNFPIKFYKFNETAISFFIYYLYQNIKKSILLLLEDQEALNKISQNLNNFLSLNEVILYSQDLSIIKNLIRKIAKGENFVLLLPKKFLSDLIPKNINDLILKIIKNQYFPYETLKNWLFEKGYLLTDLVWEEGEFAVRGSIIDIFPP
ncbi:MAG: hypothetical protein ABIK72_01825, partial [candidate division WOR-3 bacterium]